MNVLPCTTIKCETDTTIKCETDTTIKCETDKLLTKPCMICDYSTLLYCPYCHYVSCEKCTRQYVLTTIHEAHCMSCRKPWTYSFLESIFSKSFLKKEYREKQENMLFEREKAYFPKTQLALMYETQLEQCNEISRTVRKQIQELTMRLQEQSDKKKQIQQKLCQPMKVASHCPDRSCTGMIINHQCGICKSTVCSICNVIQNETHVCKEEDLQSIAYIRETSKACPQCHVMIQRTSGCDHMWCTSCHTAFRWSTLTIEKHVLPNPHYYEYLAKTATTLCQDTVLLDQRHLPLIEQRITSLSCDEPIKMRLHQRAQYVIRLRETVFSEQETENEWTHHVLRIRYLRKEITEERFKSLLYLAQQRLRHKIEYKHIMTTYLHIMSDWLRSIDDSAVLTVFDKEQSLQLYLNQSIIELQEYCTSFKLLTML